MNQYIDPTGGLPGERFRKIRQARRLSLSSVARDAGVTASFLSQFERGKTDARIATLRRLCSVLGFSLADLFNGGAEDQVRVLRQKSRPRISAGPGVEKFLLTTPPVRNVEVYVSVFAPEASTGPRTYVHGDSQEILIVLRGAVKLQLEDEYYRLAVGDSVEYQSSTPHRLVNDSDNTTEVMWVISPPGDSYRTGPVLE